MQNRLYFQTLKYIGIDVNKSQLEIGKSKYPDADCIEGTIQTIDHIKGDFVLCVQVIGNTRFELEKSDTNMVVQKLIDILNIDGNLIFNIDKSSPKQEDDISMLLNKYFTSVKQVNYRRSNINVNRYLACMIAIFLYYLPFLRGIGKTKKIYYVCKGKKDIHK